MTKLNTKSDLYLMLQLLHHYSFDSIIPFKNTIIKLHNIGVPTNTIVEALIKNHSKEKIVFHVLGPTSQYVYNLPEQYSSTRDSKYNIWSYDTNLLFGEPIDLRELFYEKYLSKII